MPFFRHPVGAPRFKVASLPAGLTPSPGTTLKLPFAAVISDSSGYWDAVNFRWLPKIAGNYFVTLFAGFKCSTSTLTNGLIQLQIFKNGSNVQSITKTIPSLAATVLNNGLILSTIIFLNGSTDYIEGFGEFFAPSTGSFNTPTFDTTSLGNSMQAFYLGT